MAPSDHVTLARIAEELGLSVTTVSRALRGRGEMSAETRAQVLDTARRLGHTRTAERRGRPRTGTSRLIDLVLGYFHDPYSEQITAAAQTAAAARGYDLVLTKEREDQDDDWPMRIRSRGSAGVVIGVITPTASQVEIIAEAGIPIALLGPRSDASRRLWSIVTTDHEGGAQAAAHLVARGAQRFIEIAGLPAYRYGRARVQGFESTLHSLMPDAPVLRAQADWTAPQAQRAAAAALVDLGGTGPIGMFACSDEMAAGAYRAIADAGLTVPGDVRVVGFDDVRGARWLSPPLTTVRQPIREMAITAIQLLADASDGTWDPRQIIELPTTLIERESTEAG